MTEKLQQIFAESLGLSIEDTDWESLVYRGVEEWDSVAHMALVSQIEDEFDIMLETDDVLGMSSFKNAVEILKRYGLNGD